MNEFNFYYHSLRLWIWGKTSRIFSLTIILNNYEDCERNSNHVYHRMESVFDKSKKEEMSGMCATNIPFGRNLQGRGGRKVNRSNKKLCLIFLTYIFELKINTAPPASNSVYRQDCAEKYFRYKNFSGARPTSIFGKYLFGRRFEI